MQRLIQILLLLPVTATLALDFPAKTIRIVDGDTAKISPKPGQVTSLRLLGIDSPETHLVVDLPGGGTTTAGQPPWGEQATATLEKLLPLNLIITVKSIGRDKYGRFVGLALLGGADINLKMLLSGWAVPYVICSGADCTPDFFIRTNVESYLKACDFARSKKLGIFDPQNPLQELPFEFRLRMQTRKPDKYIGDFVTKKLYEPSEYKKVDICRTIFFYSKEEARKVGYQ